MVIFLKNQISQIYNGDRRTLFLKIEKSLSLVLMLPFFILAVPFLIIIRAIKPFFLVRFGILISSRIGHLAANTELYLCEKDAGINKIKKSHIDIFYLKYTPICNEYLVVLWKRILHIWPKFIIHPIVWLNDKIPGGQIHIIGNNTQSDRDVHNLLDKYSPHITFTLNEENEGIMKLQEIGIPKNSKFVCLLVRDSEYLSSHIKSNNWDYHNYRDCNIGNYYLVANELTKRGYYVIRMGVKVKNAFNSENRMIIDYATSGMRTAFLDVYLGAKCDFCISTSAGWDAIPLIFRKPILYAPIVPLGYFFTFSKRFSAITKHHIDIKESRELSLNEIFERNVGFCLSSEDYYKNGVSLIENTPEEIRDLVIEFIDKNNNSWTEDVNDQKLHEIFWKKFPIDKLDSKGVPLHGEIKSRFGTSFLRTNTNWLK